MNRTLFFGLVLTSFSFLTSLQARDQLAGGSSPSGITQAGIAQSGIAQSGIGQARLGQAMPVVPSVIHGVCTVCGSSKCSSCAKCSAGFMGQQSSAEIDACGVCSDKAGFCGKELNRRFEDKPQQRTVCQSKGSSSCDLGCLPPLSVFIPRPQGANTARELAGWEEFIHQFDVGGYYLTTGTVLGYSRSFRPERLARLLFGECELRFAGSQVPDRGRCELLADNFGLSPYMRGTLSIHPQIENIIFDNQFFIGLDPLACGLYARIHMPLVHTRWNLGLHQKVETNICQGFPACYMADEAAPASCNIIEALSGSLTFGDMQQPWRYGRMAPCARTKTALADIDLIVGYNIWQSDYYHCGFYGQVVCPTGTRATAQYLFEPIVGNAKHWELGAGFSGHFVLWERDANNSFAVYCEGNVTHLFKNCQMRSFDFCNNGPLSRYMLLKELEKVEDSYQYTGRLINGINFATRPVEVSVAAKGDFSAKLCFRTPCLIFDLGCNFYGITKEKVCFKGCDKHSGADDIFYGIKGTEGVCGLEYATEGTQPPLTFGPLVGEIPLNSTQSHATIRRGARTDNPLAPETQAPTDIVVTAFSRQTGSIEGADVQRAFLSNPPVVLTTKHLHKATGTMPAQATLKVFGYLGWNFYEADWCYNPYAGIGGEVEFDARSRDERTALNQYSVWLKAGFEF